MAEPKPSPLDEPLARFARALPLATPGSLPPLAAVLGRGVRWGLGLRSDTRLPFGGTVRLLHWIASPYSDAPDGIVMDELSMGMSGDFELAIAEGATTVRVGTAIFGLRYTPDSAYWPGFAGKSE